jgi:hypothetical protein
MLVFFDDGSTTLCESLKVLKPLKHSDINTFLSWEMQNSYVSIRERKGKPVICKECYKRKHQESKNEYLRNKR